MNKPNYPLATSTWDEAEVQAMHEVIASGNFTMGHKVKKFEDEFARTFGSEYAIMSNSGSSANLLALGAMRYSSLGRNKKKEVIVPAVSWGTTYFPVSQMGYKLKFVDVDLSTLNASPEAIEAAITNETAGIFAVNLLGNPSELDAIRQLADDNGIFLIEDNCESLGAKFNGKMAGTFGDVGTFSSFFSHHISTMEGGVSVTNNLELAQVMASLRAHGWIRELPDSNYVHNRTGNDFEDMFSFALPGYNLRPLELEGAVGSEQLKKISDIVSGRRSNQQRFLEVMLEFPWIQTQLEIGESSWFGFSLILQGSHVSKRSELIRTFSKYGIETRPIVAGNFTRNPVLKHLNHSPIPDLPNSDYIHENGLFIGNHHYEMTSEFDYLRDALKEFEGLE